MNNKRLEKNKRLFSSVVIEEKIKEVSSFLHDKKLSQMFVNCFPNTLDTTVHYQEKKGRPDTYITTGVIPAMWLRDSSAQLWPYLQFVNRDDKLKKLFQGLINRQVECILLDPYANAFFKKSNGRSKVFERKWELDSMCYFIRLSFFYWKETGDVMVFDKKWQKAVQMIIKTWREQSDLLKMNCYKYKTAKNCPDVLNLSGSGNPLAESSLIRSAFRPSDDACVLQYLIPSNCFASLSLKQLSEMYEKIFQDKSKSLLYRGHAREIDNDIKKFAITKILKGDEVFAYEVDGFGGQVIMDDANSPSLLSLPYLGYLETSDLLYQNTRKLLLSEKNPYFFKGKKFLGIGSSHTAYGNIWPMSIIMQALTSDNESEIVECLKILKNTHAKTYFMHESFQKNNPDNYTRPWFSWANSLFGELIVKLYDSNKSILNVIR
jgi:meiotically up-regulated gene 157 (Mug157) protein